jgi:phospholipid transport system substrate-binding protein
MLQASRPAFFPRFLALLLAVAVLALPGAGMAETTPPPVPPASAAEAALATPEGRFIQNLGDRAIAILADKSLTDDQRSTQFRDMLRASFDLMTIGRFVIGRSWRAATPEQQQEYMRLFEELVVKTYSDRFALYTGEGFRVTTVRPEGERDFAVNSEITHPDSSAPTTVDWRVRVKEGKPGIIDVVVEGVSMSVTQRQEYAAVIQRHGGNIDGLLDLMRQRVQEPVVKQAMPASKG